jgi:hypothetical protein
MGVILSDFWNAYLSRQSHDRTLFSMTLGQPSFKSAGDFLLRELFRKYHSPL